MGNLKYIEELGIGSDVPTNDGTEQNTNDNPNEDLAEISDSDAPTNSDGDDVKGSESETPVVEDTKMTELDEKIALLEKRIADKDKYINELREMSKQREQEEQKVDINESANEEESSFWDDPEKIVSNLQETIRVQQLQIQETVYANTVKDYWQTVNPDALKEAVATDAEFAKDFNTSAEPYKTAYEYLTKKGTEKKASEDALREQIRKELLEEMGKKEVKEVPPTIGSGGSNSTPKSKAPSDGFSAVFNTKY